MTNIIRILLQDCSPSIHSYFKTSFSFNNTPWILTWIIQSCHFLIPYCNRKIPGTSAGHSRPSINGPHSTPKASPLCRPRLSSPTYCIAWASSPCSCLQVLTVPFSHLGANNTLQHSAQMYLPREAFLPQQSILPLHIAAPQFTIKHPNLRVLLVVSCIKILY